MAKQRDIRLDLIRALAIFFVLCDHCICYNGYIGEPIGLDAPSILMMALWFISHTCVPMFLMLSGYLLRGKRVSADYYIRLVHILVPYLLISLVCIAFRGLYLREDITVKYIVGSIINFYACEYAWYLMMYLGLYLLIPFFNVMYASLDSRKNKLLLIASFAVLSHLPSLLNNSVQLLSVYFVKLWPFTFYLTGLFLGEYRPKLRPRRGFALLLTLLAAFSFIFVIRIMPVSQRADGINYDSYQIFILSVLLFVCLNNIDTGRLPRVLTAVSAKLSELSFCIFLISGISDALIYPMYISFVPDVKDRYVWTIPAALASLLLSALAAKLIKPLCDIIERRVTALLHKLVRA